MGYTNPSEWVMILLFTPKCHFLRIWWKSLMAAGILRINIWFSVPVLKIKFDPPHKGKVLWCSYFKSFIKSTIFFQNWKFCQSDNFWEFEFHGKDNQITPPTTTHPTTTHPTITHPTTTHPTTTHPTTTTHHHSTHHHITPTPPPTLPPPTSPPTLPPHPPMEKNWA